MSDEINVKSELLGIRRKVEGEAVEVFDSVILPKVLELSKYAFGDACGVARVTSSDEEMLAGRVAVEYSLVFEDKNPDPFQLAQRIVAETILAALLTKL